MMDPVFYFAAVIWPKVQSRAFKDRWGDQGGCAIWASSNDRGRVSIDWKTGKSYFAIMVQEADKPMRSRRVRKNSTDHFVLTGVLPPFGCEAAA